MLEAVKCVFASHIVDQDDSCHVSVVMSDHASSESLLSGSVPELESDLNQKVSWLRI